ncbi:MAG: tetratricopeptide repeat protein [Candidatus Obscuribacterales bacterium]|nr:tetratricopeptide repeat protein [Candidatus Obscuribacterales bacterium]
MNSREVNWPRIMEKQSIVLLILFATMVRQPKCFGENQLSDLSDTGESARAFSLGQTPAISPVLNKSVGVYGGLHKAISSRKLFHGAAISAFNKGRQAVVAVYGYKGSNFRLDAILAARAIANTFSGQFLTFAIRYYEPNNSRAYKEVLLTSKDITSLEAGTSKLPEFATSLPVVEVSAYDGAAVCFEKYLIVAEQLISKGSFFEAEQIVDSLGPAPGGIDQSRYTRDMMHLAQGFDSYGDSYRAARILESVVEQRRASGSLFGDEAELTVDRLIDLYLAEKRFEDAEKLLNEIIAANSNNRAGKAYINNLERLGVVLLRQGKGAEALLKFKEVLALRTASGEGLGRARTLENLGDAHRLVGSKGEALSSYRESKALYDKAVVSPKRHEQIDFQVYSGRVKQLEEKMKHL